MKTNTPDILESSDDKPHPWGVFLHARAHAIDWLKEGYPEANDAEIAKKLSIDETQVTLIRTRDRTFCIYPNLKITIEEE